jgi:hypothetical protein
MLKILGQGNEETPEVLVDQPAVLEARDNETGELFTYSIYKVLLDEREGKGGIVVARLQGARFYPIEDGKDINAYVSLGKITFSSYGRIYTIRSFEDSDGVWASRLHVELPAQALEENFVAELKNAFSPNAPKIDDNLYAAVDTGNETVAYLVYSSEAGLFIRDNGAWFKLQKDSEDLDDYQVVEVNPKFIKIFDMESAEGTPIALSEVRAYEVEFRNGNKPDTLVADASYGGECPPATQDINLNLKNRQNAIDNVGYGPLNPAEPNDEFWQDKADRWNITSEEAKTALCGNCVFFIRTPSVLKCIEDGIGLGEEAEGSIAAGELGYCSALDFKCAAERTCNAWAVGGPITEESEVQA